MSVVAPTPRPPERFGRWRLERCLGEGGFGSAWLARDFAGQLGVVKLLHEPPGDEIRALAKIHHPAVVPALGAGTEPSPYLVMGYAPGRPLGDGMEGLSAEAATRALAVLADALAACHDAGVHHGDIKPDNVLYDPDSERLTIIDFGLAGGQGGTPRYASPERPGAGATAAADVYAIGLIGWELFTGQLPWADDAPFTDRSNPDVPRLPEGRAPEWLADLLVEVLQPDPGRRPSATGIVDACEARGVELPRRTPDDVARRARTLWVDRPGVTQALDGWLDRGGALSVVGPRGSGRSHVLARAANELQARGTTFVTIYASDEPWGSIEAALADPSLPGDPVDLPHAADPITRAEAAAEALLDRVAPGTPDATSLVLLVDDGESLDDGTRRTLAALGQSGAAILSATDEADGPSVVLQPFDRASIASLLTSLLGSVGDTLIDATAMAAQGLPRDAVAFIVAGVEAGALVWSRRSWVVDAERLDAHAETWVPDALPSVAGLSAAARTLGAVVALAQPIDRVDALAVSGADDAALAALHEAGLVRGSAQLQCSGAPATAALAAEDPQPLARALVHRWMQRTPVPLARLGPILAGAGDVDAIDAYGADCISALAVRDVEHASKVASDLWAVRPSGPLAVARTQVLQQAGRIEDAREAGIAHLGDRTPGPDDVPILIALANVEGVADDLPSRLRWIEAAVAATGEQGLSTELRLARAQASLAADDRPRAEDDCLALCAAPPVEGEVASWLHAKRLLSQLRATEQGAAAGLAVLDEIPEDLGKGTRERARIEGDRGRLLWHTGRPRDAAAAMEQAATYRRALPLVDRARLENNAGLGWYSVGDIVKAVACWERALLAFERIGAPRDAVASRVNLCQGYRELGRWARAETIGKAAVTWTSANNAEELLAMALGNLGDVALWQRKLSEAEAHYAEAQVVAERLQTPGADPSSEIVELARRRAEIAALRGDADLATRVAEALGLSEAAGAVDERARCLVLQGLELARRGQRDEAEAAIGEALSALREMGAAGELAIARLWAGEAWLALNLPEQAAEEAGSVIRYAEEFVRPPLQAWAEEIRQRAQPDRTVTNVERLTQVAVRVTMQASLAAIFDDLAQAAVDLVGVDRALVVLLTEGSDLEVVARAGQGLSSPPSMSIVQRVLHGGREIVAGDLEERGDLRENASVVAMNLRAAMCMPLAIEGEILGALYLDSRGYPGGNLHEAASLARGLAAHASVALRNAQLAAEIEQRAIDAEGAHRFADALLRAVPTPVVVATEDGVTVDANDAAVALFGGNSLDDLPPRFADCLDRLEGGLAEEYQLRVPSQRRVVPVRVNRAHVETPDGRRRIVFALADLTPRIAAEAQQIRAIAAAREASAAKDRFLASMSHELRTPLNAIIGYTELVLEDVDDDVTIGDLNHILSAGQHLLGLIDDVLDISRIEAGRLKLSVQDRPLSEVFAEVVTLTRPAVLDGGARFDVELPEELGHASTDHRRVRQVCTNLLMNAIHHSQGNTVGLFVEAGLDAITVEVRDDGIGIPAERLEMLFTPFVRLASHAGGAGLGLAIARRLAEQLGGDLTVDSTLGEGSTFRFRFRRCLPDEPLPVPPVQ